MLTDQQLLEIERRIRAVYDPDPEVALCATEDLAIKDAPRLADEIRRLRGLVDDFDTSSRPGGGGSRRT